jgi:hypothetical protein
LVRFFVPHKEMNKRRIFRNFFVPLFCVPKKVVPPKKGTPADRVLLRLIPSPGPPSVAELLRRTGTFSRGLHELAHSGAQTA